MKHGIRRWPARDSARSPRHKAPLSLSLETFDLEYVETRHHAKSVASTSPCVDTPFAASSCSMLNVAFGAVGRSCQQLACAEWPPSSIFMATLYRLDGPTPLLHRNPGQCRNAPLLPSKARPAYHSLPATLPTLDSRTPQPTDFSWLAVLSYGLVIYTRDYESASRVYIIRDGVGN